MTTNLAQLASGSKDLPSGSDRVEFRRIPYDIKKAQARFLEAGLSDFDAERIAVGS